MITHFDSSFAGHIDLDNVGYGGTPSTIAASAMKPWPASLPRPKRLPTR